MAEGLPVRSLVKRPQHSAERVLQSACLDHQTTIGHNRSIKRSLVETFARLLYSETYPPRSLTLTIWDIAPLL
jgi:hypothetical protein